MILDMNTPREEDQDAIDLQKELLAYSVFAFGADNGQVQEKQLQAQTLPPSNGEDLTLLRLLGLGNAPASDAQDQYIPAIESNLETIEPNIVSFPISTAETQKTVPGSMLSIQDEFTAATTAWLDVLEERNTTSADLTGPPPELQRITATSIPQWQQVDGQSRSQWASQQQQINTDNLNAGSQWEMQQDGWNPLEVGLHCSQGQSFQKLPDHKAKMVPFSQTQGSMMQLTESDLLQQQIDEVKEKVAMLTRGEKQQRSFLPSISYLFGDEESDDSNMKFGSGHVQSQSLSLPGEMGKPNPSIFPSRSDKNGMQAYAWCQGGQTNGGFPSRGNQVGTGMAGAYTTASSLLPSPGGFIQPPFAPGGNNPPRFGNVTADAAVSYTGPASTSSDLQKIMVPAGSLQRQLPSQNLLGTRPCPAKSQPFSDPTLSSNLNVTGSSDLSIARSNSVPPPVGSKNDIKRPRSAYNFFYRSERTRLLDELGQTKRKVPLEVMTKTIAGRWKSLTSEQRAPFKRLASTDKERYERELRDFNIQERQRLEYLRKESNSP